MEEKKELEEIIFEQETQPEQTEEIAPAEPAAEDVQETMEDYADELEASFRTFSVGDVLSKILRDLGGRRDRERTHDIRIDLFHRIGNRFVAGQSVTNRHNYFSSFPKEIAWNGHTL